MVLTYSYRLLPTKPQHRALERILETQRQLYNAGLEERIGAYRSAGVSRTYIDQCKGLTEWRHSDPEAASIPVAVHRWTLKRLDGAYRDFFSRVKQGRKPGFPRFRSKGRFVTFGFNEYCGIRFRNGRLLFKGIQGALRVHLHRPLPENSKIISCVFRRDLKGWRVGIVLRIPDVSLKRGGQVVGVDLGLSTFAVLSDGGSIPSVRAARTSERRIRIAQRALMRKVRGSNNRRKARLVLARRHAVAARARSNHLHQASARLVRDYDVIVVENLRLAGMRHGLLAKDIYDAAWAKFISMLRYKAECAGGRIIEVDPFETSQDCSGCGVKVPKQLKTRLHKCPHCGLVLDRDLNAARNILNRAGVGPGLLNVAGCGMRAGGNLDEAAEPKNSGAQLT